MSALPAKPGMKVERPRMAWTSMASATTGTASVGTSLASEISPRKALRPSGRDMVRVLVRRATAGGGAVMGTAGAPQGSGNICYPAQLCRPLSARVKFFLRCWPQPVFGAVKCARDVRPAMISTATRPSSGVPGGFPQFGRHGNIPGMPGPKGPEIHGKSLGNPSLPGRSERDILDAIVHLKDPP